MAQATVPTSIETQGANPFRSIVELVVCLIVLVSIFRVFLAGGYLIETGSMAPCLVGKHRPVQCPNCKFRFAVDGTGSGRHGICPNCDERGIDLDLFPLYEGDHLLVFRGLYEYRAPRRWEVIVFQNPGKPRQAYVKRLIGLPGESVQIRRGDIYVSGEIQTKDYATQCGLRIPVFDNDFRPSAGDAEWRSRWRINGDQSSWSDSGGRFRFSARSQKKKKSKSDHSDSIDDDCEWVSYRHWIRAGGFHKTSVPLTEEPENLDSLPRGFNRLRYDAENQTLICQGALPRDVRDQLSASFEDAESQEAIAQLYELSHIAPIVDEYGYNPEPDADKRPEVRDLMISMKAEFQAGPGKFVVAMANGDREFQCIFDREARQIRLHETGIAKAIRTADWSPSRSSKPIQIELSIMDRQVLVAVDGKLPFKPWHFSAPPRRGPTPWVPVSFGACGGGVEVSELRLFRDVYYTDDMGPRGVAEPVSLRTNEYFVLGDNSPVSKDSRSWTNNTVLTGELLLGKPLFVHLPSANKKVRFAGKEFEIRIPEFSRMRYIH